MAKAGWQNHPLSQALMKQQEKLLHVHVPTLPTQYLHGRLVLSNDCSLYMYVLPGFTYPWNLNQHWYPRLCNCHIDSCFPIDLLSKHLTLAPLNVPVCLTKCKIMYMYLYKYVISHMQNAYVTCRTVSYFQMIFTIYNVSMPQCTIWTTGSLNINSKENKRQQK